MLAPALGAETISPSVPPSTLIIEASRGRLTLEAHGISRAATLAAIAAATGHRLRLIGELDQSGSDWSFRDLPLQDALKHVVAGTGWVLEEPDGPNGSSISTLNVFAQNRATAAPVSGELPSSGKLADCSPGDDLKKPRAQHDDVNDQAVRELGDLVARGTANDALSALAALDQLQNDAAVRALEQGLGASDPAVRSEVVQSLGRIGTDDSIRLLAQALYGDSSPQVRSRAMQILQEQPNEMARLFLESSARRR